PVELVSPLRPEPADLRPEHLLGEARRLQEGDAADLRDELRRDSARVGSVTEDDADRELRDLLASRSVAALGTLHDGAPYVSMVPFALLPDGSGFLIHVSELSAHTGDMLADPRVSLLVKAPESPERSAQELPRVTIVGRARPVPDPSDEYDAGKACYLARFPD